MKQTPESTQESTTPITTTTPSTTIVTYDGGDKYHWEGSCPYFKNTANKNTANIYTPCAVCARVKKTI
jgi:hypothetical protein